jgi:hypothetical protein
MLRVEEKHNLWVTYHWEREDEYVQILRMIHPSLTCSAT